MGPPAREKTLADNAHTLWCRLRRELEAAHPARFAEFPLACAHAPWNSPLRTRPILRFWDHTCWLDVVHVYTPTMYRDWLLAAKRHIGSDWEFENSRALDNVVRMIRYHFVVRPDDFIIGARHAELRPRRLMPHEQ